MRYPFKVGDVVVTTNPDHAIIRKAERINGGWLIIESCSSYSLPPGNRCDDYLISDKSYILCEESIVDKILVKYGNV